MGATQGLVQRVFVTMGAVIGCAGTALGLAVGLATAAALSRWHVIDLPSDVYFLDTLPVRVQAGDVLLVALASLALCLLATIHPARRAAALVPVEAIRVAE
jgi:lipoprotein-releasing system permease protein